MHDQLTERPLIDLLDRLCDLKCAPREIQGPPFTAACPVHGDLRVPLRVSEGEDDQVFLHCAAGCTVDEICNALEVSTDGVFAALRRAWPD